MSTLTLTPAAGFSLGFCVNKNNCAGCAISSAIFRKISHLSQLQGISSFADYLINVADSCGQLAAAADLKLVLLREISKASDELAVLKSGCSERRGPTCGDTGRGAGTFPALATPPSNTGVDELLNSGADLK